MKYLGTWFGDKHSWLDDLRGHYGPKGLWFPSTDSKETLRCLLSNKTIWGLVSCYSTLNNSVKAMNVCRGFSSSTALFLKRNFLARWYFLKYFFEVILSPPFGLELVIHSIISTSCQEGHPAIKTPLDGGGRGRPDPLGCAAELPITHHSLAPQCWQHPLPGSLAAGPALHCPLLLPALLLPHCLWNPELRAACGMQVMGSSISGLKLLMKRTESALFISLTFRQQTWTFPSLLLTLISSVKLKIIMGNTSNTFIRLPGVPCRSWLHMRDWNT